MKLTLRTHTGSWGAWARVPISLMAVVALVAAILSLAAVRTVTEADDAGADVSLNPSLLDPTPVPGAGVQGVQTPIGNQNWRVKAFAQIDDRLFVGGAFLQVRDTPYGGSPTHNQSFIAAFDVDSNEWISTWTPNVDGPVWALDVTPSGKLLVGGEFSTVNGTNREGLVALDPLSGSINPTFEARVDNAGSNFTPSVRDFDLVGNTLYVAGDFNRIVEGGDAHGVYRVGRVDATTGDFDTGWRPMTSGGAVWDVAVDTARGKVHLAGQFTSVNAQPDTKTGAVVYESNANSVPNHDFSLNGNWQRTFGVDMIGGNAWYAGEQHYLQIRDGQNFNRIGCMATGYSSINQTTCAGNWVGGAGFGGDYQFVEEIDGYVVAGCHCRGNHWNSITQTETDLNDRGLKIYNSDGTETSFYPGAIYWNEGPYAAFRDSHGCLYIGGDYVGNAYGFARYCQNLPADNSAPTKPVVAEASTNGVDSVTIDWNPSSDNVGVVDYLVHREYQFRAVVPNGSIYTDTSVQQGQTYRYQIRARDAAGNVSPASDIETVTVNVGGNDNTAPSTPGNVSLATNGVDQVTIDWSASTDNVGVTGYLVHRDYQYLTYRNGAGNTSHVDNTVQAGQEYRYQVRAQDAAGNNSTASPVERITVSNGGQDNAPPSTPVVVSAAAAGGPVVNLDWNASSDNVGVTGYLVHRDYQYLAYVSGGATAYSDASVQSGTTYRYQVRAQDAAGNNSPPSALSTVSVP